MEIDIYQLMFLLQNTEVTKYLAIKDEHLLKGIVPFRCLTFVPLMSMLLSNSILYCRIIKVAIQLASLLVSRSTCRRCLSDIQYSNSITHYLH